MTGCIPLSEAEINGLSEHLSLRDRALLFLGVTTGLRITELLSLKVGDVWNTKTSQVQEMVSVKRASTKKKVEGKTKKLIEPAKTALTLYLSDRNNLSADQPLFGSQKGGAINRRSVYLIIKNASVKAGLAGRIGTHSMRKTYAKKVYEATKGDYMQVKLALGHKSVASTESYLQFIESDKIDSQIQWSF